MNPKVDTEPSLLSIIPAGLRYQMCMRLLMLVVARSLLAGSVHVTDARSRTRQEGRFQLSGPADPVGQVL